MKKILNLLIPYLKNLLIKLEKITTQEVAVNSNSLISLAPKIITDKEEQKKIDPYLTSLKNALDSEHVNNIAITGSYGSGKSTILKTFQFLYPKPEYEYLNISLASFCDNKEDKENFERKLEISILQQMFYHVKPSKIPDSRFKRIVNLKAPNLLFQTVFFLFWIASVIILLKFDYINLLNPNGWSFDYKIDWFSIVVFLVFFSGIGWYVKSVMRLLVNSKISKVSIKGEVELNASSDKSVFNQHLEEILYFFEKTNFNVVLIEDVDRFGSTDIFTKLREINILINNSELIKRKVKFVYAIKDEMFKISTERVKFFELIIPIIPFINPSNASDQLTKMIKEAKLENLLHKDFTDDVVTFIDDIDMRLLINIFHEYQIYSKVLSSELSQCELFSIIVYKNMYPEDFGELSKRRGKLYKFLSHRSDYANILKDALYERVKESEDLILSIESEFQIEKSELRAVYIYHLVGKLDNFHSFYTTEQIDNIKVLEDTHFNFLLKTKNIQFQKFYKQYSYNNEYRLTGPQNSDISFVEFEKEISKIPYSQREKNLLSKTNGQIESLKREITALREKINEIETYGIKEIFEKIAIDNYIEDFKESNLIRYLLLNGYINENYSDYISVFHAINLTHDDFTYEAKVKNGITLPYDHPLTNSDTVVERLQEKYFRREAILNFAMLNQLLSRPLINRNKLNYFFENLKPANDKVLDFISGYMNSNSILLKEFTNQLVKHKPNLWSYIVKKSNWTSERILEFVKLVFQFADYNDINSFDEIDSLIEYISKSRVDYISTFSDNANILKFIENKSIKLEILNTASAKPNQVFEHLINNNSYAITAGNIKAILCYWETPFNDEEFYQANYTLLYNVCPSNLLEYINNDINSYLENILIDLPENHFEKEESLIKILNNVAIKDDLKNSFLKDQQNKIQSLSNIPLKENKELAIALNIIHLSWVNVNDYFVSTEIPVFNDIICNFLNNDVVYDSLSKVKIHIENDEEDVQTNAFCYALIYAKNLNKTAHIMLLNSLPFIYSVLDYKAINSEITDWLIRSKIVTLTKENFDGIKNESNDLHIQLLEVYESDFLSRFEEFDITNEDLELIFNSSTFTYEGKLKIIHEIDDSIIINNPAIARIVGYLLPVKKPSSLRYEVFNTIFSANPSIARKIELLNINNEKFDDKQIQGFVESFGEDYARLFINQNKPIFSNRDFNRDLFQILKSRNLISSYSENPDKDEIKVIANYR